MRTIQIISVFSLCFILSAHAQKNLVPTLDSCLVEVTITDIKDRPIIFADLVVQTNPQRDLIKIKTDRKGKAQFLMPKKGRQTYEFKIDYRGDKHVFERKFKIPADEGEYELTAVLKYEPKHLVLPTAQFESNKSALLPSSHQELEDLIILMTQKPDMMIEVLGHTDSIGDLEKNIRLSMDRATSVKNYLVHGGISAERIKTSGHGPKIPIADNATPEGRQLNRRMEVKILKE